MWIKMLKNLGTVGGPYRRGRVYEQDPAIAAEWIAKGIAIHSAEPPPAVAAVYARLEEGAGETCVFLPFCGEFGHEIMHHVRLVHFHQAARKIVCCRPGHEVLYPSAWKFITDWKDPIPDRIRAGTIRDRVLRWPEIERCCQGLRLIQAGGLSTQEELVCIHPERKIPFKPQPRLISVDVVIGVRNRQFCPEKNWPHCQAVADRLTAAGYTFAVMGAKETSFDLAGQSFHTGDLDLSTDAAIELLQNCRLYIGSDSGGSHLAATVGAPMLVFRLERDDHRNFLPRMALVNPQNVEIVAGWNDPQAVADRALQILSGQSLRPTATTAEGHLYVAQHGEDRWMNEHWGELGLPDKGTFVEVGAADGIRLSNTYWLAKARGWKGLLIEPDPRSARYLAANRPESLMEAVAVGQANAEVYFGLMNEPTLSGIRRQNCQQAKVPLFTLTRLLEENHIGQVDVLSIDTEGTELEVWDSLDLSRWRPRLVIIEWHTVGLPTDKEGIITRMTADGYQLRAELGGNLLFVRAA